MDKVTFLDAYNSTRASVHEEVIRGQFRKYGVELANWSFEPDCRFPLSLQCLAAGWEGYRTMKHVTGWWLATAVPGAVERRRPDRSAFFPFYNHRGQKVDDEYPIIGTVTLHPICRIGNRNDDDDYLKLFEDAVDEFPLAKCKVPLLVFSSFLHFANKDMGFRLESLTVTDTEITITVDSISERMVVTVYPVQFHDLLNELKEAVVRRHQVEDVPDDTDWSIYEPKVKTPKE